MEDCRLGRESCATSVTTVAGDLRAKRAPSIRRYIGWGYLGDRLIVSDGEWSDQVLACFLFAMAGRHCCCTHTVILIVGLRRRSETIDIATRSLGLPVAGKHISNTRRAYKVSLERHNFLNDGSERARSIPFHSKSCYRERANLRRRYSRLKRKRVHEIMDQNLVWSWTKNRKSAA